MTTLGPHSDYECSRCAQRFDLPVGTTACPACHKSRWFTRVYSANVSTSGISARKDPQLEAAYTQAMRPKEAATLNDRQRGAPMLAVDTDKIGETLAHVAKGTFQSFGLPENQMGGINVQGGIGALRPGKSSWKKGEIHRNAPVDPALTG